MMKRLIAVMECAVLAGMLVCVSPLVSQQPAEAQWQVPTDTIPRGRGTGTGFATSTWSINSNGTLTGAPTANSAAQGLVINQTGPTSGSTAGDASSSCWGASPSLLYNSICISGEGADVTGTAPVHTYGFNVGLVTGGANSTGNKAAGNFLLFKSSASAPAVARDHVALGALALADGGDGGTGTSIGQSKGTLFATGFQAVARSGATNLFEVSSGEASCSIETGASASYRFCWNIVSGGQVNGAVLDAGLVFGSTSIGFNNGILFANANGSAPITTAGCAICSNGSATITSAIDFSSYTITSYLIRGANAYIDGAGNGVFDNTISVGETGVATGSVAFVGGTSGTATIVAQAAAGTPTLTLPNASGTFVVTASSPLARDATTGNITCTTCATTAGPNLPAVATGDILYASATNTLSALPDVAVLNVLISGGVGVAPSWGKVALGALATQAANTVLGNATSGAAVPTALAVASCSTSSSALNWTTNTGFGCNTSINAATLLSGTWAIPGTIGSTTPNTGAFTTLVANSFVPNSSTIPSNGMYLPAANTLGWAINSAAELQLTGTALSPAADGGNSLGTTALGWQNLFSNTGFVWNIENGNWVATHTSGILTVGTGDLRVTTAGTNTASVVTVGGTQTFTNKTFDSAGTGNVLQISGVTVSRGQYPGESTTGSATAGNIGEYVSGSVALGASVSLTNLTATTITSISLTAGDWDLWAHAGFAADTSGSASGTGVLLLAASISGTTNTLDLSATDRYAETGDTGFWTSANIPTLPVGPTRVSISGTTTYYLVSFCQFSVTTCVGSGKIQARRAR